MFLIGGSAPFNPDSAAFSAAGSNPLGRISMFLQSFRPKILPLTKYERKIRAPNAVEEEGVIEHIFHKITAQPGFCVEFGAGDGINFSFTRVLIDHHGWGGLLIEADPTLAERLEKNYRNHPRVVTVQQRVNSSNIEEIFLKAKVPNSFDFLCIDIDGNDYYLWEKIESFHPKVVCIEYNASYDAQERFLIDYDEDFVWSGDDYYGASMLTLCGLAKKKGFELVHCKSGGDNLFFVAEEFFHLFNIPDNSVDPFYQLPQYGRNGRARNGKGHPASKQNTSWRKRQGYKLRYRALTLPRAIARALTRRRKRKFALEANGIGNPPARSTP